jgi:ribonuclease HI
MRKPAATRQHSLKLPPALYIYTLHRFLSLEGAMPDSLDDFQKTRADLNEEILGCGHLGMKRFFALDHQAYEPGALSTKTKELLGLVASMVLRCDDCIAYHLVRSAEEGWARDEVIDALNVALVVGGSITVPHVRRAFARMREIDGLKPKSATAPTQKSSAPDAPQAPKLSFRTESSE